MLIQFSIKNFRSLRDQQVFSMSASRYYDEMLEKNTIATDLTEKLPRILRSTGLYGPNASGKSTFVKALAFVKKMVIESAKDRQASEPIDVQPFRLSAATRSADSEFEIQFIEAGVRYQFGFCVNPTRVTEEWLYAFPNGHQQKWYHRVYDTDAQQYVYQFSKLFSGGRRRQDWKTSTRDNALFLSTAIQLNNEQLRPVFDWFRKRLGIVRPDRLANNYTIEKCRDETAKAEILRFLQELDLSIEDIQIETVIFTLDTLLGKRSQEEQGEMIDEFGEVPYQTPFFLHRDVDTGELIAFDEKEESDGTRNLFSFAGPWQDVMQNDRVLVVDEIDTSLHPKIVHRLIQLLHRKEGQAQLIFTAHDTSVMSQSILRRDQIWLVERSKHGESRLYPLSTFKKVREHEAIEKGYLSGRYGAVPVLRAADPHGH
ncbi:MAG: ATP-binding protein [Betaproteobacteria bacterium]|nr:ATP-binding protein [Betaproteobacteria bacterium]